MTTTAEIKPRTAEIDKLSKTQKLATLLVLLGPESAAHIMKELEDAQLEAVSREMSKISLISQQLQREILIEFSDVAVQASTAILGGVDFTQRSLEKSVGLFRASDIINRVAPTSLSAFQPIEEMEPDQIFNLIKHERAQTIALVLSCLPAEKASRITQSLSEELRSQAIECLATLAPTSVDVVERVVQVLIRKRGQNHSRAMNQSGGLESAADLLKAMEKKTSRSLLTKLEERNPELGQEIRKKLFTFDNLALLDRTVLQRILREVDTRELATSLKNADEHVKNAILGCISKRAAETVHEEIDFMRGVKRSEIELARNNLLETVRNLEAEGEIEINEEEEEEEAS